jgi:cytochrome c-type biogenesis protein CcmH/NrfF
LPQNKRKLKASLLILAAATLCLAQSASEYETAEVNGVAAKLNCSCGCKLSMACVMPPTGMCPVCRENKIRIAKMLADGMSEREILKTYASEQGAGVLVVPPGEFGFAGPFIALGLGLGVVLLGIRRYRRLRPAPVVAPADDAEFSRYHDQIEKDLAKLE